MVRQHLVAQVRDDRLSLDPPCEYVFLRRVNAKGALLGHRADGPKIRAAIAGFSEHAWTPIRYPRAIWDDQLGRWVSSAQVAEVKYTAFTSRTGQAITARLIVRRVKNLNATATAGQGELLTAWRHHAIFTDSPFGMLPAEQHHRGHAQAEQVFADWSDGPLAHLPSGSFAANAAWLALAAISHNLLRAAGALAGLTYAKARGATIHRDLIAVAARTARHGRGHLTIHLPAGWHREHAWMNLFHAATGSPTNSSPARRAETGYPNSRGGSRLRTTPADAELHEAGLPLVG